MGVLRLTSPVPGTVLPLADVPDPVFAVEVGDGRSVLVHVGIDTVSLAGLGFDLHVERGRRVRAGERVLTWSPVDVAAAGLATVCPVVALQAAPADVRVLVEAGTRVDAGSDVLEWTAPDADA